MAGLGTGKRKVNNLLRKAGVNAESASALRKLQEQQTKLLVQLQKLKEGEFNNDFHHITPQERQHKILVVEQALARLEMHVVPLRETMTTAEMKATPLGKAATE